MYFFCSSESHLGCCLHALLVLYFPRCLPSFLVRLKSEAQDAQLAVSIILCNLVTSALHPMVTGSDGVQTALWDVQFTCLMDRLRPSATSSPTPMVGLTESSKVDAILSLLLLAQKLPSLHLFDRFLPHLVELTDVKHHSPEVSKHDPRLVKLNSIFSSNLF